MRLTRRSMSTWLQPTSIAAAAGVAAVLSFAMPATADEAEASADPHGIWVPINADTMWDDWTDPWIAPPDRGTSGAPRQGWLNTLDGFFTKEWHLAYAWTNDIADGADEAHQANFRFNTPLTKRLWVGVDVPFLVHVQGDEDDESDFGDASITIKKMYHETDDVSLSTGLGVRLPTGEEETGGDLFALFPHVAVWTDVGNGWSLRGGVGIEILPDDDDKPDSSLVVNFAFGQTLNEHYDAPLGDFTYYVAANLTHGFGGEGNDATFVSLTPGVRGHVGDGLFVLLGLEVPVAGPRPFNQRPILQVVKGF